jgi:CPA1 family monovalent cation:H+ antiporter
MDYFLITSILVTLAAAFGYINVRFLKLPNTIGLMLITIVFTLAIFGISYFDSTLLDAEKYIITQIDFKSVLLDVMLSFLLFAGALHTNFEQLKVQRWPVLVFATFGVLISTFLVGTAMFYVLQLLGMEITYIYCLLFGALISPTDPIAVLGILKKAGAPKRLETKIVGESLFNDGVGVVIFLTFRPLWQW